MAITQEQFHIAHILSCYKHAIVANEVDAGDNAAVKVLPGALFSLQQAIEHCPIRVGGRHFASSFPSLPGSGSYEEFTIERIIHTIGPRLEDLSHTYGVRVERAGVGLEQLRVEFFDVTRD